MVKKRLKIIKQSKVKFIAYLLCTITIIFVFTLLPLMLWLNSNVMNVGVTSIIGDSMLPTFDNGTILYIQPPKFERGEIIVFDCPDNNNYNTSNLYLFKRIVGLPGETLSIKEDGVYINGVLLNESKYTDQQTKTLHDGNDVNEMILSDNEYFLIGDNRSDSFDSRHVGGVHARDFLYGLTAEPNEYTKQIYKNVSIIVVINFIAIIIFETILFHLFSKKEKEKM